MRSSPAAYQLVHNPLLPVDGRARRAKQLFRAGRRPSSFGDDFATVRFLTYLQAREASRNRSELCQLRRQFAGIAGALRLRAGDAWRQLEIQARLLTGQSMESIGACFDVMPQAIAWYEQLFFAVHNRLTAADYIQARAIRGVNSRWPRPPLSEFILGQAYFGGRLVLESALAAVGPHGSLVSQAADLTTCEGRLVEQIRLAAQLSLLPAASSASSVVRRGLTTIIAASNASAEIAHTVDIEQLVVAAAPHLRLDISELFARRTDTVVTTPKAA